MSTFTEHPGGLIVATVVFAHAVVLALTDVLLISYTPDIVHQVVVSLVVVVLVPHCHHPRRANQAEGYFTLTLE